MIEPGTTIRGSQGAVLDGTGLDLPFGIRVQSLDGSRLDGFTLDGLTIRGYMRYGSQVTGVDNFWLTGTRQVDNPGRPGESCTNAPTALSVDTLSSTTTRVGTSTSRPMVLSCATLWSTSTSLH